MRLEARDVTVHLTGRPILERVSCRAEPGKITAVIGPNGAGKSTLLRAMAGLLPLEGGGVAFDGRPLDSLGQTELARSIAYLPQERTVHWPLAVERVVALGRLPHRTGMTMLDARDRAAVDAAMRTMDVTALAQRPVSQLSGGERARVLVARALAQESRVLIADEPTAGLDPAHALGLFGTFEHLAAEGRAVIVALHDLTLAARFCHHVVLLVAGRVAANGPAAEVLQPAPLSAAFGVTIANGMIADVPIVLAVAPLP
jgi:iron complex transport system ATP-binding protein